MNKFLLVVTMFLILTSGSFGQVDSLIFKNGNTMVGEVKTMTRNVLEIETDYSDDDFKIEWDGIKEVYTTTFFLITLSNGSRYNGRLQSSGEGKVRIIAEGGQSTEVNIGEIVLLDDIDQGFWSQLYASIDFGLDITKANNFRQVSMRSNAGYIANRWQLDGTYNSYHSRQDEIDDIKRMDAGITFKYFLPHDWYPLVSAEFLSNTEQQIQLRTNGRTGIGKYVIHTNLFYWGFSAGANYNNENYSVDTIADRHSWEGFIGTELNLFNMGDLSLQTSVMIYPSITEAGRWRSDFKFDAKYDLPLDFYIKLGLTVNYDNKPATPETPESDYIFHTGFGWEW